MKSLYEHQYDSTLFARAFFGKTKKSQRKLLWCMLGIMLVVGAVIG